MQGALYRKRVAERPKLPTNLNSIVLTDKYTTITRPLSYKEDRNFLIYKSSNNRILVFCSLIGLEILSKSDSWHGDGTFHVAAKYYYQLYLIHAWIMYRMIPCVFALMGRRREKDYDKVFNGIKKAAIKLRLDLKPKIVMTDLELAAIKSFRHNFRTVNNKGCLFHFGQAISKKFKSLGFETNFCD